MRNIFDYLEYFVNESELKKSFIFERNLHKLETKVTTF